MYLYNTRRTEASPPAFENVKDQLGYYGLWCGSYLVGNGTLNALAGRCGKAISDYGVREWGPKGVDYDGILSGLDVISTMEPCRGCLKGGGRTNCEIRACAVTRGLNECAECDLQGSCENDRLLQHMRAGAGAVGMKVNTAPGCRSRRMKEWMSDLERT